MANIKLFGALFAVLFAVATATTYTTTVTTITTTEDQVSSSEKGSQCQQEIRRKDLQMCESFLSQDQQQGGGGRLRMVVRTGEQEQGQKGMQQQCCQQLKQVKPMCRCAAIKDVVKQQMQGEESMKSQKMRQVLQKAQNLPRDCDFDEPQECRFEQPSLFA